MQEIVLGAGGAAIAQEAFTAENVDQLAALLQKEPTWSDLPLLVLTTRSTAAREHLLTADLLGKLGNVTLIERPMRLRRCSAQSARRSVLGDANTRPVT